MASQNQTSKDILVTGAASGIGFATAERMSADGRRVWLADIDAARLDAAAQSLDGAVAMPLDVCDEAGWQTAVKKMRNDGANVGAVVHAAGISAAAPIAETSLAEWRRVQAVNLDGAFLATKFGAALLGDGGGAIVHIASASGVRPTAGAAAYCSSKAAVRMLARVAALELKPRGIRVNCICPGGVRTPMWESMDFFKAAGKRLGSVDAAYHEMETQGGCRFATPEDIAATVAFLLSDAAKLMTGAEVVMDDGFTLGAGGA